VDPATKTGLVSKGLEAYSGISTAQTARQNANTAQAQAESSVNLQSAQTAREVAQTEQVKADADVKRADAALKRRELRGKGVKDTFDREGGQIIQKLFDNIRNSAKTPSIIQKGEKARPDLKLNFKLP